MQLSFFPRNWVPNLVKNALPARRRADAEFLEERLVNLDMNIGDHIVGFVRPSNVNLSGARTNVILEVLFNLAQGGKAKHDLPVL